MDREKIIETLVWDDRALGVAAYWGLRTEDVEAIIRHDPAPVVDPHADEAGHTILRYTRGDVVVVVGFRDPNAPKVLHVATMAVRPSTAGSRASGRTRAGTGPGSSLPTSQRDLKKRILALGYRLAVLGSGHLAVIDRDTERRIVVISSTPRSAGTVADDWKRFLRAHHRNHEGE